jgi:hypothetical protein
MPPDDGDDRTFGTDLSTLLRVGGCDGGQILQCNWCSSSGRIGLRSYSYVSCTAEFVHLGHASSMLSALL